MENTKGYPYLRQVFFRILLFRMFIPLIILAIVAGICAESLGQRNVQSNQKQVVQSIGNIVEYYLDHGGRILDAIAKMAETSDNADISAFMNSTWKAYGYFETIYCLDKENKILIMAPSDPIYTGLDMSNLPDIKSSHNQDNLIISRPFISFRTGDPIVYLIRPLSQGGYIIGELNLGVFQHEIENITKIQGDQFAFIVDQSGTLISHPDLSLVKEQTNINNLEIVKNTVRGENNSIYIYNDKLMLGSSVKLQTTGWIVVSQIPLTSVISSYKWLFIFGMFAIFVLMVAVIFSFRKQIQNHIITPLEQLTDRTTSLAVGDFSNGSTLPLISSNFIEIHNLMVDFQLMSDNLQSREIALKESENSNRGLVERLPLGLFTAELNGEIVYVNPMARLILGYDKIEETVGINITNFLVEALIDKDQKEFLIENIFNLNNYEIQIKNNNEKVMWIEINSHVVYDYQKHADFFEISIQDITERKQNEFKIKEQQELLIQSEKEKSETLEKTLAMKDEFISLISHELKTPLNVIYSAIQLIECVYMSKIPERVQELIGNIKQNTFRQLRLANNLLDITRMNSGQIKINMRTIDVVFLIKVICESVELYANQKNISINFDSNITSKMIVIDDEKVERIILNILSNAIKFTESEGNITIKLSDSINSDSIQIEISDTGIGIPEDKIDVIFERFGQVDSNLSRRAEGTGIGLSLVKLLVDNLGGTINVSSKLGVGSTFTIILPTNNELVSTENNGRLDVEDRLVSEIKVQFSDIYL
ncbi:PAS domain S-box-containing protein [Clostridium saccharoperbutylacetonicum]|uniref:histidine kinase n=1 Tax=Clostridium saccharoperbutylacetonicum N1-4(HMT) TaxID=931276 RepID=M1MQ02_9CLOT|nr:ATP-binding protein [Clostridium saccharoperbutylacetonicum]AGF56801.1 putative signal transduction histidine kinase [Clostridium saccharoperbutylacetonicum N1-4(HMT)]NRT62442.1 PAS domain S-box-containing protein [Clostridium saccharoperbutylacetonicum]NSB25784.1 PAS domain S-box-containing protein [Clostridium saccharoperbutylacetonicum]NSB45148.1 PAS domain S-box-containing protein [Clostridium saccharoperbutylacetonicum]